MYDFAIIGSGASGGVFAYELSRSGAQVVLLEAGRNLKGASVANEMRANAGLYWNGGMELTRDAATVLLRGKVVGGGTTINGALLDRFDSGTLARLRASSGASVYDAAGLEPDYDDVERHLNIEYIDRSDWNENARLFAEGFDLLGLRYRRLRRGQSNCNAQANDCMQCMGGCPRNSKQSTAATFLPKAIEYGLTLQDRSLVSKIRHYRDHVTIEGERDGQSYQLQARRAILAAGALGTTGLLLRSDFARRLPALGDYFYCHPQMMTVGLMDRPVDGHRGAYQALTSEEPRFHESGFKLENVLAGPIAMALIKPGFGPDLQRYMQAYRHMMCIEVALREETPGRIRVDSKGRLQIQKPLKRKDRRRRDLGLEYVREIMRSVGAREIINSRFQIGLHLMGGSRIGAEAKDSVVDHDFRVHGFENLIVADSSIIPVAPGYNPSLTIMAQSRRAARKLLRECGVTTAHSSDSGSVLP